MMQSEQINEIATAIAKMQAKIEGVSKDASNPHFKSRYATLAACWDACHEVASANGIAIVQTTDQDETGNWHLYTTLLHSSGQWVRGRLPLIFTGNNPMQALGSALTYARRYGLCAAVGLAPEDDDGEGAGKGTPARGNGIKTAAPRSQPSMPGPEPWQARLDEICRRLGDAPNRAALDAMVDEWRADLDAMPDEARKQAREAYRARLVEVTEAAA
jgi:hypothetical protein